MKRGRALQRQKQQMQGTEVGDAAGVLTSTWPELRDMEAVSGFVERPTSHWLDH